MNIKTFLSGLNNISIVLFAIIFFNSFDLKAQSNQKTKSHYSIINPNNENQDIIIKAITHTDLDSFRFVDKRRLISIDGTNIQLELYSGNELLNLYGKQISPNNEIYSKKSEKITLKIVHEPTGTKLMQVK